jgi:predicted dienelactone hydrolase
MFGLVIPKAGATAEIADASQAARHVDQTWLDRARAREVPVRLYLPSTLVNDAPLLLFSHGLGGSRAGGARWGRFWADHGFISVHMQHHGSDESLWKDQGALAGFANLRRAMNTANGLLRVQDAGFVLDEIARRRDAGDPLLAGADLTRVGMSGHSFGARTTISLVSQMADARIRAAIGMSPVGETSDAANRARSGRITLPFLSLTGTEDRVPILNDATPEERRLPYQYMPGPDKYLLVLGGADHMVFNGDPESRRWSDANRNVHAPLIEQATLAFWNAYLRRDRSARELLSGGGMARAVGSAGEWLAK